MSKFATKIARRRNGKRPIRVAGLLRANRRVGAHSTRLPTYKVWGLASRSEYQRRICALEMELSQLRDELDDSRRESATLQSLRQHYAELFDTAPVACVTMDLLGRVLECNSAFLELVGLNAKPAADLFFTRVLRPGAKSRFLEHMLRAQRTVRPVTCEVPLVVKGKEIPVQLISMVKGKNRADLRVLQTVVLDMTEQLQAQEARAKTQSDFKALVDTIQGVVWEADPATLELTYVSPQADRVLGYGQAYWDRGMTWESHVFRDDRERVALAMRKLSNDRVETAIEYRMVRADRSVIWVNNRMSAAVLGNRLRLFGVVIDITDRKRAEEELRMASDQLEKRVDQRTSELRETISDLEAFSYSLSHDLRAPLRSMQGYAQLLFNSLNSTLDATARTYFQRLISSTERLDCLVKDVLKFTQVSREHLELRPVDLERVLAEVINNYPVLLPPSIQVDVKKPLLPVRGHEALLTQCISNLLSNAAKFHRAGESPAVKISTQDLKSNKVRVWFEDNGIGIAPQDQRRIFSMFERVYGGRQYEGTGMGLAIVAKAVQRMEGHVGVESAIGQGSKFWFELPAPGA